MRDNNKYLLENMVIITPFETIEDHNLLVENGKISQIVRKNISVPDINLYDIEQCSITESCPRFMILFTNLAAEPSFILSSDL